MKNKILLLTLIILTSIIFVELVIAQPNCMFLTCGDAACGSGTYCAARECCGARNMGVCVSFGTDYWCPACRNEGAACTFGAGYEGECCSLTCVNPGRCCPASRPIWNGSNCVAVSEFPTTIVGIIGVVIVILLAIFIPKLASKKKSKK